MYVGITFQPASPKPGDNISTFHSFPSPLFASNEIPITLMTVLSLYVYHPRYVVSIAMNLHLNILPNVSCYQILSLQRLGR
jgi:hypothetical protein